MQTLISLLTLAAALVATLAAAEPVRLRVDFSKPDGTWAMPALAASDPVWHQPLQPYTWETPRVDAWLNNGTRAKIERIIR